MDLTSFFARRGAGICSAAALVIALMMWAHLVWGAVVPIADGEGYALRTFALYGHLHTGQWGEFGRLLVRPGQSILAPHDVLFFLLPQGLAGPVSYPLLLNVTTWLLLACAIVEAARVLDRPAWAPAIFGLCAFNNLAWIDFYAFFREMTFCACAFLIIAWQMRAWKTERLAASLLSGAGLGLLFFVKPANALIVLATYVLAEIFRAMGVLSSGGAKALLRDAGGKLAGLIPVLVLACLCGAGQTILLLIQENEVDASAAPVACSGLLRLFYFPLCLAVCYHVLLLGGLLVGALIWSRWRGRLVASEARAFPIGLLLPVALAYLGLGEFFSFGMEVKPVRALLVMLPLGWFGFCWLWEKGRLRIAPLATVAVIYAVAVLSQKAFDSFGTRDHLVEDNYQLAWSSWTELPSPWHRTGTLSQGICEFISAHLPPAGVICVNAIEVRNALAWRLDNGPLLRGETPPYAVRNLFNYRGAYYARALENASCVALVTFSPGAIEPRGVGEFAGHRRLRPAGVGCQGPGANGRHAGRARGGDRVRIPFRSPADGGGARPGQRRRALRGHGLGPDAGGRFALRSPLHARAGLAPVAGMVRKKIQLRAFAAMVSPV